MILNWAAAVRCADLLLLQQEATFIFEGMRMRKGNGGERLSPPTRAAVVSVWLFFLPNNPAQI